MTDSTTIQTGTAESTRIVVGVDGSPHSAAALRWALRQAVLTGARVEVLACWHRPAMVGYAPVVYVDTDVSGPIGDAARAAVADAVSATAGAADVQVGTTVVEGDATWSLIRASADADLLVVGSRGHNEFSGVLLGSVGLHCATHAVCPVLIVHDGAEAH